ncbi:MAG: Fic family protein [Proteobacteria bacterium]|nr:Fic family protein [Pseudomonadota bacterium]
MGTRLQEREHLDALERAVASFPEGGSVDEIAARAKLPFSRRTLQRRLAALVDEGRIVPEGQTRALRYRAKVIAIHAPPPPSPASHRSVSLSEESQRVVQQISRPTTQRKPVAYNREFLSNYKPNKTFYLSAEERARLRAVGSPSDVTRPAGTYAQAIIARLLIDLSWNSSRLEGNTYSLLETERLLDQGEEAEGKAAEDAQMILNHKDAIEFLVSSAEDIGFNRYTILNLHALLANNLLKDPAGAGRLRHDRVGISASVYLPPEVPQLIDECFDEILKLARAIDDPFEQAFFVMVQLPYLQPFIDVNKRTSRLAANIPLIKNNLAPLSFVEVPKETYTSALLAVYELNDIGPLKDVFIWSYERSASRYVALRQTMGEPDPFKLKYRTAMRELIAAIVRKPMGKKDAVRAIEEWARDKVVTADRERFIEAVDTELLSLHEGNFARYQVRPSEFEAWQKVWNAKPAVKKPAKRKGRVVK